MDETGTLTTGARRFRTRRRRFLLVATAALAAVGAAMGISFTADTGTATVSVTAGTSSTLVFPVAASGSLPSTTGDVVNWGDPTTPTSALAFATTAHAQTINTPTNASWSPVSGAAGSVTTPGDLFVIDGRSASAGGAAHITVNVYVTNLAPLQAAYSSFAWPVDLYFQKAQGGSSPRLIAGGTQAAGGDGSKWEIVGPTTTNLSPAVTFTASNYFLTNTGGFVSYYLPTGTDYFYEIALDSGGSFYTVNSGGTISPQFFVTAQAT